MKAARIIEVAVTRLRFATSYLVTAGVAPAAAGGAALVGTVAAAAPAAAAKGKVCSPLPSNADAPHILGPCDGAKLTPGTAVSFKIYGGDTRATTTPPYILISRTRKLSDGHLAAPPPLGGDFHTLTSVPADPTEFAYTSPAQQFPQWWENTPGTYYVQVRQTDARAGKAGRFYSPITTVTVR